MKLLYFARLRERLGCAQESIERPPEVATVAQLRLWLAARGGQWTEVMQADRSVRVAVNQDMAQADTPIADADEVAFFPPVTGG